MKEILQRAHEDLNVRKQADSAARMGGFTPQLAQASVHIALLGGSIQELCTPYYLRRTRKASQEAATSKARGKPGNGIYPILSQLGLHYRVSPAVGSEVTRLAAQGVQRDAIENLAGRGINLKLKVLQRITRDFAERALHHRLVSGSSKVEGESLHGKRIVIEIDGGRIRLREDDLEEAILPSLRRKFKAEWREPKLFVVYELDADGKREKKGLLRYDATLGNADEAMCLLEDLLNSIGAEDAEELIFLSDGAAWIWSRFDDLAEVFSQRGAKVTHIVDFYHAAQHLQSVANAIRGWSTAERANWMKVNKGLLVAGKIELLLDNCKALCRGRNAKKLRAMLGYFENHAHRMRYGDCEQRKLPIGSGAVESGIRRVVNLRLKGNGIFWTRRVAEGILHLRAQLLSGRWFDHVSGILTPYVRWNVHRSLAM